MFDNSGVTFEDMLMLVQNKCDEVSWNTIEDLYPELYNLEKEISEVINKTLNTENNINNVDYKNFFVKENSGFINFGDFHVGFNKIDGCLGVSLFNNYEKNIGYVSIGYDKDNNFRIIDSFIRKGEELTKNKDIYDTFSSNNLIVRRNDEYGPIVSKILNELRNDKKIEFLYNKFYEKKNYYCKVSSCDSNNFCELDSEISKNIDEFLDKKISTKYGEVKFSSLFSDVYLDLCDSDDMNRDQITKKNNKILKSKFPDELLSYFKYYDNAKMRKVRDSRSKSIDFINDQIELAKIDGKLNSVVVPDEVFFEKDENGVKRINSKLNRDDLKYIDMFTKSFKDVNIENENLISCNMHFSVDELYNKSLRNAKLYANNIALSSNCDGADFRGTKLLLENPNDLIMLPSFDNIIRDDKTVIPYENVNIDDSSLDVDKMKEIVINKINGMNDFEFLEFMSGIPKDLIGLDKQYNGKVK